MEQNDERLMKAIDVINLFANTVAIEQSRKPQNSSGKKGLDDRPHLKIHAINTFFIPMSLRAIPLKRL